MAGIRTPAVAGLFYPGDPERLKATVDEMTAAAAPAPAGRVRAAVSPHAGYPYSGRLAARSLTALARSRPETVVVVGPSHVEYFPFTSVFDGEAYATPLGEIPVDRERAAALAEGGESLRFSPRGHMQEALPRGEHALEVQLPFLQRLLPGVHIVPVVMGEQGYAACMELGEAVAGLGGDVAVVASSDLSHFYPHDRAEALDRAFADVLATRDPGAVFDAVRDGRCEACGAGPVIAALRSVQDLPGLEYHMLERTNSGAATGDRSSVVGYLAAVYSTPGEAKAP